MALHIPSERLYNQRLSHTNLRHPAEVVSWMGAVQAQDFAGAKWALGLRSDGLGEADVEASFTEGSILRTHILRPTWHFVSPADIRWMLALTAPRVRARMAYNDRQLGLDESIRRKSLAVIVKALRGGKQLTRSELGAALQRKNINTNDLRLAHLVMHAELDGVICSGARQGKQFTYALLDERVSPTSMLDHDESAAALARGYFRSHGPATLKDFSWWSGLAAVDVRRGLELVKSELARHVVDGETYWFVESTSPTRSTAQAYLLPNYDEYTVGYADRRAIFDPVHVDKLDRRGSILAQHVVLTTGQIVASWKRTLKTNAIAIEVSLFKELKKREMHALIESAERYATFLGLAFELTFAGKE